MAVYCLFSASPICSLPTGQNITSGTDLIRGKVTLFPVPVLDQVRTQRLQGVAAAYPFATAVRAVLFLANTMFW